MGCIWSAVAAERLAGKSGRAYEEHSEASSSGSTLASRRTQGVGRVDPQKKAGWRTDTAAGFRPKP
jgi:hypothetical protein